MIGELDIMIRLVIALFMGGVIGYQRESCNKSAGLRTHILVCIGSCLIMVLSINIYHTVQGLTNADPTRLAAQVVSGIGFLGAGTIMKEGPTVKGLTTAASLWVVSGVGLAAGSGYFISAAMTTCLVFLALTILSRVEQSFHIGCINLVINSLDMPGRIGKICAVFTEANVRVRDIRVEPQTDNRMLISVSVQASEKANRDSMTAKIMEIEGISSVKVE